MSTTAGEPQASDRFIAFFDVLGWKNLVEKEEQNGAWSVKGCVGALDLIYTELERCRDSYAKYGPMICPNGECEAKDMGFRYSTFSDNVALSVEVSPVALVNLLHCCSVVYFKLFLRKGFMSRGYVTRGRVHHTDRYCLGSGLNRAVTQESKVNFRSEDGSTGTPFIQLDKSVIEYIEKQAPTTCAVEMFHTLVERDDCVAAIFPFKRLDPVIFGDGMFDPEKGSRDIATVRSWIDRAGESVRCYVDSSNTRAREKGDCLMRMLDAQARVCDEREKLIASAAEQYPPGTFTPGAFPGLFDRCRCSRR